MLVALVFVFPDGRLPTRRWRPVAIAAVVCFALLQVAVLFEPQHYVAPYTDVTSPLPSLPALVRTALTPFWLGAFAEVVRGGLVDRRALPAWRPASSASSSSG